jgi:serine/threonine protein kinase
MEWKGKSYLGHGSFCDVSTSVLRLPCGDVKNVALKILRVSDDQSSQTRQNATLNKFLREAAIHSALSMHHHPNIINMLGYVPSQRSIVLEISPFDLNYILYTTINPKECIMISDGRVKKKIILGILSALRYMHENHIIHCDVKPKNILLTSEFVPQLTDFGSSECIYPEVNTALTSSSVMGTAGYMAPELLVPGPYYISSKVDIFSLGIIINEIIREEVPFYESLPLFYSNGEAGVKCILEGQRPVMDTETMSTELQDLIERCWSSVDANRPECAQILTELSDIDIPSSYSL